MYMQPDRVVDKEKLYAMYDLSYDDVDEAHRHLIPYMKEMESGDLVLLDEYDSEWTWLMDYYMNKKNRLDVLYPTSLLMRRHMTYVDGKTRFGCFLSVPSKPAPYVQEQIDEKARQERKEHRRKIWWRGFFTLYEMIKLMFGK